MKKSRKVAQRGLAADLIDVVAALGLLILSFLFSIMLFSQSWMFADFFGVLALAAAVRGMIVPNRHFAVRFAFGAIGAAAAVIMIGATWT